MKTPVISPPTPWRRLLQRWLALALLVALASGCAGTFHEVRPLSSGKPPAERPTALVLGTVAVTDTRLTQAERELYALHLLQGAEAWLARTNTFASVTRGTQAPAGGLLLGGTLTEVEKGSSAARFWVGMGAGQARIQGEFELKDASGQSLVRFSARRSYLGGSGIGGIDTLSMEELASRLGQTVAETAEKWVKGQKVE